MNLTARSAYIGRRYKGEVLLIASETSLATRGPALGWEHVLRRPPTVVAVPGNHSSVIGEHAAQASADAVRDAVRRTFR